MNTFRLSLASMALVLTSIALGGCAADAEPSEEDQDAVEVVPSTEGTVAPMRLGYVARVTRADIIAGGGRCAGNLCTINGGDWNCGGGGYCSKISY